MLRIFNEREVAGRESSELRASKKILSPVSTVYICIRTVSSYHLLIVAEKFKLVYGLIGQSNMHNTISAPVQPGRKRMYQYKREAKSLLP